MNEAIVPDDKDWTWVLERACPECGFDAAEIGPTQVAEMLRANTASWAVLLEAAPDELRRRPVPERWSTLEYAAHVRDVFRLYDIRLGLMLDEDDPLFANWDQDETAIAERYNEQDPALVAADLVTAGTALAARFDGVAGGEWERRGRRSDGASFTVDTFARYLLHDPVHHLWDVERPT
jgi:DinB superfamily